MARRRIQGITIEIGGDTTKLQSALKGVESKLKRTQASLKDVNRLLKLDPGNTELLTQKQRLLGDSIQATNTKADSVEVQTETINIKARALPGGGEVKAKTGDATDATTYDSWFSTVYRTAT